MPVNPPPPSVYEKGANVVLTSVRRNLRDAMSKDGEEPWGATEITIDRPGAFKYAFSYEPPKRLAGKFDQGSYFRFNTYVADYAASKGSHVSAARKQ